MSRASEALKLAGDYGSEGYSQSEALEQAWDDVHGNPASYMSLLLLAVAAFTGGYKRVKGYWPWDSAAMARNRLTAVRLAQQLLSQKAGLQQPASTYSDIGYHLISRARDLSMETLPSSIARHTRSPLSARRAYR
jgi:hypothetical protein